MASDARLAALRAEFCPAAKRRGHVKGAVVEGPGRPASTCCPGRCSAPRGHGIGLHSVIDTRCGQRAELEALFDTATYGDTHAEVETTWLVYQRMVATYRNPDRVAGRRALTLLIETLGKDVPTQLVELTRLGRTLAQRAGDVLAYFDRPDTSNGPTEAINGRLKHLRGSALGFQNLTNYIARSLLVTGGFRPLMDRQLR